MNEFVLDWLSQLDENDVFGRQAADAPDVAPFFMMANITPLVGAPDAQRDALVLYAVLATFQQANFPGRPESAWSGPEPHLEAAFAYANEQGRAAIAHGLLSSVQRATEKPGSSFNWLRSNSLDHDPGRIAAHEQEMAGIRSRDIRAAAIFDPTLSIDDMLLNRNPDN
ncbi:hypothetical protein [Curtobacterium flaccumfaciens]|uniref:hypothetical protein n=1 Tax=Curtobacterium flaccumfaciens TaxID=2035 RepID=UPI001BDEA524|nr:hypothetical protein [Curtobacterium flaccumfaciens]MBT1683784.1 hypothetical protein [Curtobacterium flaccumfaciens pv. flaccumfaciens]